MNKTIAFIGGGNMGGAILRAVCRVIPPCQVILYDADEEKGRALSQETGCRLAADGQQAVREGAYVVMCVKPQVFAPVLAGLLPALREGQAAGEARVLVSIAAGIQLEFMRRALDDVDIPAIRIMPNTPALVGKGTFLVAPDERVSGEQLDGLMEMLSDCGLLLRVSEHELDLGSTVSGCGPAFVYMLIEALADGGVQIGLPREMAQTLAANMVLGSAAMVLETGEHPGRLKDAVCSPGGTTIAGVAELEKRGFRAAAAQAVVSAWRRNGELIP